MLVALTPLLVLYIVVLLGLDHALDSDLPFNYLLGRDHQTQCWFYFDSFASPAPEPRIENLSQVAFASTLAEPTVEELIIKSIMKWHCAAQACRRPALWSLLGQCEQCYRHFCGEHAVSTSHTCLTTEVRIERIND